MRRLVLADSRRDRATCCFSRLRGFGLLPPIAPRNCVNPPPAKRSLKAVTDKAA
jgi:hypothetical protein